MDLTLINGVQIEPITIEEAKLHLRVDGNGEDSLISSLISVSREYCENFTGRAVSVQTFEGVLPSFPSEKRIELPMPPLKEVAYVRYVNSKGEDVELSEGEDYLVITKVEPGVIYPVISKPWPVDLWDRPDAVRVKFTAGYDVIPNIIRQAMLLLIGHFYENREAVAQGNAAYELPFAVKALLFQYKIARW